MTSRFASSVVLALAGILGLLCLGGASSQRLLDDGTGRSVEPADYQRAMPKRAALLLDRLLVALQQAVENKELQGSKQYVRSLPNFSDVPETQGMLTDEKTIIRGIEEMSLDNGSIIIVIENVCVLLYFQVAILRIFVSFFSEAKFQLLYERISKDYQEIVDANERREILQSWNFSKIMSTIYTAYYAFGTILYVALPTLVPSVLDIIFPMNVSRPLSPCLYTQYYVDEQEYYFYIHLHYGICIFCSYLAIVSFDITFYSILFHLRGLLDILRYVDQVQDCYGTTFFLLGAMFISALSIGTIAVMLVLDDPINLIRYSLVWSGIVGYSYFICCPGQELINKSEMLLQSVYCCEWYDVSSESKFMVMFMLMRCQKPCQITAGPLQGINFKTSSILLQTSMQYFTVMFSLQE